MRVMQPRKYTHRSHISSSEVLLYFHATPEDMDHVIFMVQCRSDVMSKLQMMAIK